MTISTPGSLKALMDALESLENTAADAAASEYGFDRPRVYRWRPTMTPELPAVWNWMTTSPYRQMDLQRFRDTINISCRVGLRHTDVDEDMAQFEELADVYREIVDLNLAQWKPLQGAATKSIRTGMGTFIDRFDQIEIFGVELLLAFDLDRQVPH